jgi:hypothetical protein
MNLSIRVIILITFVIAIYITANAENVDDSIQLNTFNSKWDLLYGVSVSKDTNGTRKIAGKIHKSMTNASRHMYG